MKIITFLLFVCCLQAAAKGHAQNVTLNLENVPVQKVFTELSRQTGISIVFSEVQLNGLAPVSINVKDATVQEVLDLCLKNQPLNYKMENDLIVINKTSTGAFQPPVNSPPPINVRGIVTNEDGEPVAGATVTVKGSNRATSTDGAGRFSLNANEGEILVITSVGFETNEIKLSAKDTSKGFRISMIKKTSDLDAVVILPYGTTTKRLNTGNISTVTSKTIQQQPVSNPLAALQGRVPGLFITQTTGTPGGGFKVQIRGQSSLINGTDPFILIDGVPYNSKIPAFSGQQGLVNGNLIGGSPLNFINSYDIESIEVLKDADATAIYGSRAANGAILITTKKGKVGATRISVNINSGLTSPGRDIPLMNTQQYLQVRHEAFKNDSITIIPASVYDLRFWDTTRYTNWSKTFLQNTAVYTDANASISGGNTNTQYLIGGGFNRQTTGTPVLIRNAGVDTRATVHFNLNTQTSDQKLKFSITAGYTTDLNTVNAGSDLSFNRFTTPPVAPSLYSPDGSLNWMPLVPGAMGTWNNPLAALNGEYRGNTTNLVSNATVGYTIFPGLEIKTSLGYTKTQIDENKTVPTSTNDPGRHITTGLGYFGNANTSSWIIEPQVNYKRNIGRGVLTALFGGTFNENNTKAQQLIGLGFVSDALLKNIQSAGSLITSSNGSQYKYNALYSRLNYNWEDKYVLNFTARRDGSSRFGPGKQFGDFWSAGGVWIFSNEKFTKDNLSFLSFGKLRASYGTTGNDQVGDYRFIDLYSAFSYSYLGSPGLAPQNLFNPNLAWELDKKLEGGLDLGFLKDRISISASIFRNRSGNQLVTTPVSAVTGFPSIPANLPAVVQNTGQEFLLNTVNIKSNNFTWSSSANLTIPHNKLLSFPGLATSVYASKYIVGQPITILKVYNELGVNPQTGVYEFAAANGTPTYSPNSETDMTGIINTAPKYYGGFSNSFTYKTFSLDILFQFVKQIGKNFFGNYNNMLGQGVNFPVSYFNNHWQKPGDVTKYQMASQSFASSAYKGLGYAQQSDLAYSDASFIRLKNVAFSWQIPERWKEKAHLQNCRIFINAQNLLTITKYDGLDPETQSVGSPPKKVWVVGIQMSL